MIPLGVKHKIAMKHVIHFYVHDSFGNVNKKESSFNITVDVFTCKMPFTL